MHGLEISRGRWGLVLAIGALACGDDGKSGGGTDGAESSGEATGSDGGGTTAGSGDATTGPDDPTGDETGPSTGMGTGATYGDSTGAGTGGGDTEGGTDDPMGRNAHLVGGLHHVCRLVPERDEVLCWGDNDNGQLGDQTTDDRTLEAPAQVLGLPESPVRLFAGSHGTCAQLEDGAVWCWGRVPGVGDTVLEPTAIPLFRDAIHVDMGRSHACRQERDGTMGCWGSDSHGQLGDGPPLGPDAGVDAPVVPLGLEAGIRHFTSAMHQTRDPYVCAIERAGSTYCWGANDMAALGLGEGMGPEPTPLELPIGPAIDIASVHDRTCAILEEGDVYCWGGLQDLVGGGLKDGTDVPTRVPLSRPNPVQVIAGGAEACARFEDGVVGCWWGNNGQTQYEEPLALETPALEIAGHWLEACARLEDGRVACWEYTDPDTLRVVD